MASIKSDLVQGLVRKFQAIALGITGVPVRVIPIPRESGDLGYTSKGNSIHLSFDHPILDNIKKTEKRVAFVTGVFAHELMHRIATDFVTHEKMVKKLSETEGSIFHEIFNVIEDPAIEYQAPMYIGGHLIKCLSYTVGSIYKQTKPINERSSPFGQFIEALIMYGDGGILNGDFTHPEAKEVFYKVLPTVDQAITCIDGKKRIMLSYNVFQMSKCLWETEAKNAEAMKKLMDELRRQMAEHGKGGKGTGDGSPLNLSPDTDAAGSSTEGKSKRRKVTYRKVSKEEMERLRKDAKPGGGAGDGDIEVLYCDEEDAGDKKDGSEGAGAPESGENEKADTGDGSSPASPEGDNAVSEGENANEAGTKGQHGDKGSDKEPTTASNRAPKNNISLSGDDVDASGGSFDHDKEERIDEEEYELTDDDIRHVAEVIDEAMRAIQIEKAASKANHAEDLSVDMSDCGYRGVTCLNVRVKANPSMSEVYDALVSQLSGSINLLANQLKRIIQNQREEKEYRNSGRTSIKRLQSGRLTTQVFRRHLDPTNKADVCVTILADESGSMGGQKSHCVMQSVVGLAEVFARLHIPVKVIGFTADQGSHDVTHYHYMHWLNTREERIALMNIKARSNNFDGYSIRYATRVLKERKEQHKLFIIISDGQPACYYYHSGKNGMVDTANAVAEAAKAADVVGVGIGLNERAENALFGIYGRYFISCRNANDLFANIGKIIAEKIKNWE